MMNYLRELWYWKKNPVTEQELWNYLVNRAKTAEARVAELEALLESR